MKQDGRLGGRTALASLIRIPSAPATPHKENAPAGTPPPMAEAFHPPTFAARGARAGELAPQSQGEPREAPLPHSTTPTPSGSTAGPLKGCPAPEESVLLPNTCLAPQQNS